MAAGSSPHSRTVRPRALRRSRGCGTSSRLAQGFRGVDAGGRPSSADGFGGVEKHLVAGHSNTGQRRFGRVPSKAGDGSLTRRRHRPPSRAPSCAAPARRSPRPARQRPVAWSNCLRHGPGCSVRQSALSPPPKRGPRPHPDVTQFRPVSRKGRHAAIEGNPR